ncbi:MAG: FmdB family zinc ribbon protein [Planctomycetota bacterium]|jgi:putative FmdB family regulatory protein
MPTYEYICLACGHEFELFQQMTAPVKRKCPECTELKLQRKVGTGAGIIFRGSGFFQTDYRSDAYKKALESEKKTAADGTVDKDKKEQKGGKKDAKKSGSKPKAD